MSEALNKFILGKAKTRAAFQKKFSGQDGALSLMELVGDAPKSVQKQAQKIFQANPNDVNKAVQEIANLAYGSGTPAKKTGAQGKTNAPPERIEGDNLPNNPSDSGTLAPVPAEKGKRGRKPAAEQPPKKEAAAVAPPPKESVAEPEAGDGELDASIGQFVSADGLGEVDVAGAGFMPPLVDPRTSMMVGANPTPSSNPSSAGAFDMDRFLSDPSLRGVGPDGTMQAEPPAPNTPAPIEPKADLPPMPATTSAPGWLESLASGMAQLDPQRVDLGSLLSDAEPPPVYDKPFGPYRDGLFDWNAGSFLTPEVDPSLPGTIDPQGGFLGQFEGAQYGQGGLGFAPTPDAPRPPLLNPAAGLDEMGEAKPNPWATLTESARARGATEAAQRASAPSDMPADAPADSPAPGRPPFYDPNRSLKQWWNEPGLVSRANEFLYQRGMPAGIARAVQPTASVLDKTLKVAAPLGVALGAGYGLLKGAGAIANMGGESTAVVPPSDEEQAALEAKADESMRQLQQILGGNTLRNPASAPPAAPVK
jgi:hypothetical protein